MKVLGQIDVQFKIGQHEIVHIFLMHPSMNSVVLGNPFFCKKSIKKSRGKNKLKGPKKAHDLNEIKNPNRGSKMFPKLHSLVVMAQKVLIKRLHQIFFYKKTRFC